MRWIRILLIVLVVLVVVIGGAVVFVLTLDLNNHKDRISGLVERFTGRVLILDGRVDLELGALTSLELTDARFGNPEWATEPWMARLARGKLVVDLRSILDGPIIVERFELDDAELHLESLQDGRNNWTFGAAQDPADAAEPEAETDDVRGGGIFPLVLKHAEGEDLFFSLSVPALPRRLEVRADQAKQQQAADGLLDATVSGRLNERTISLSGKYGPLANLVNTTDVRFDVSGKFDTLTLNAKAMIDDLTWPRRPTIDVAVSGPAVDDVTEMLGLADLGDGGLDLRIIVEPDEDGVSAMVKGSIGEYATDTTARADELLDAERFTLTTKIDGKNIGDALGIFGIEGLPGGPFELDGRVLRDVDRLEFDAVHLGLGSATFDLNGTINDFRNLDETNLKLQVYGNDVERFRALLGIPGAATGPFQISADLNVRPDGAELLEVLVQTNIARLKIDGSIRGKAPDFVGTKVRVAGTGRNLADVAEVYEIPNVLPKPYSLKGAIELGEQKLSTIEAVQLTVGEGTLTVEGTVGYAPLERDTDVQVHATGQDLARLVAMAGVMDFVPSVPFDIATGLAVTGGGYRVRNLDAKLGDNIVALDGTISRSRDFVGTRVTFSARGPNLADVVADTAALDFADGPFDVSGKAELLDDVVRLERVRAEVAGAKAELDAEISLPLESAAGRFNFAASGPNLRTVLPARPRWEPTDVPFDVRASGMVDDGLWMFDTLTVQIADARLSGNGQFDQPPDLSRTTLEIKTTIPDLAALGSVDDKPLPSTNAAFDLVFAGSPESFRIDPFNVVIGNGDVAGSLRADLDGEVPDIDLRLRSNLLNLDAVIADEEKLAEELPETGDAETDESAVEQPADERVIADEPLPFEQLEKFNARVDVDVATAVFRGVEWRDVMIDGKIRDGRLLLERANAVSPSGDLKASFSLIPQDGSAKLNGKLDGTGIYLGLDTQLSAEELAQAPAFDAQIELAGVGATPREIAGSLDGNAFISAYGGRVPNNRLGLIFGNFFLELLNALNPFRKDEKFTKLDCLVLLLDVDDGLVKVKPGLIVQTDKLIIAATGLWNLNTEKIDIGFKTQPRSKVSISAGEFINPYLKVGGTMRNPQLTLDPTGTLVTGGAAVATAGLSLLATAVWDRVARADDPCAAAIEESMKDDKKRKKFLGIF